MSIDANSIALQARREPFMSTTLAWIVLVVVVVGFGGLTLSIERRRSSRGLTVPPRGVSLLTIGLVAAGGIALVLVCTRTAGP